MIHDFADFCLWTYVVADDIWQQVTPFFKRPGPAPICSDSELISMALIGECRGLSKETELLSVLHDQPHLFSHIPSQSRFNRRRRQLMKGFNLVRQITLPRRNQKEQLPPPTCHLINTIRQIIETVNGQLTEQFEIETNYAHTFWGLCTRLYSKLTAHTVCIYLNRLLGKADFLQIKSLAFPN